MFGMAAVQIVRENELVLLTTRESKMITRENGAFDFVSIAKGLMLAGNIESLKTSAHNDFNMNRLLPHIEKAAASTDSVSDLGYAFGLAEGFLNTLDVSALDVMRTRPAPVLTPILNLSTAVAGVIAEKARLPVITSLERLSLEFVKTGGIAVATKDQLRSGIYGESMLGMALRNGISSCSNRALVDSLLADAGTATITASGATGADILADIATAADDFELDALSRLYLLASPQRVKDLALKHGSGVLSFPGCGVRGGELVPDVITIACPGFPGADSNGEFCLLVDAGGLLAHKGDVYINTSDDANLMMIDPDGGAETRGVSLFQEDLVGLKYVRTLAVKPIRPCVTKISGIAW